MWENTVWEQKEKQKKKREIRVGSLQCELEVVNKV